MTKNSGQVTIPFTKIGYDKVIGEIAELEEKRKEVLVRLQAAREMGDLSENGAYKAARWELSGIDRRLRQLHYWQHMGRVVETKHNGVVEFGSQVKLRNDSGKESSYILVNEFESNPIKNMLSINSPLGSQLEGKKVGDVVVVEEPAGKQQFQVLEVS